MKRIAATLLIFVLFVAVLGSPRRNKNQGERKIFKYPLSPYDKRLPDGKIAGQYTSVSPKLKWPNATVYWAYDPANNFTATEKGIIKKGMQEIQNTTCIKFIERTTEAAYINIKNDVAGCFATSDYQGTKQDLNLEKNCFGDATTTIHEIMHAMGFDHEQNRYDRDMYVEVQWDNIEAGRASAFEKQPRTKAYPRYPYDFFSLMQYFLTGFGIGGRPTLVLVNPLSPDAASKIGNAPNMSRTDILRIRSAYKCDSNGESSGLGRAFLGQESNFAKHNFF
ncbi:hatching enzyme 1.2-like [Neocloeon triangulifer]|uniref:hatching enzyme 1.2-like n=1 Tax=Neocloeon triangulifer TaxID=2078957 RepID=UPI00286EEA45|nr:hatching enzyme 1.2-like [Neocloeon triangulifer]